MGLKQFGFSKLEKLTSKKDIEELFKKGSSFYLNEFQVRYLNSSSAPHHKLLISVPKRNFKRAVDRNLLKRRIREAYRLNKHLIENVNDQSSLSIAFIYLSKQVLTFDNIQAQLIQCLERLGTINVEENE